MYRSKNFSATKYDMIDLSLNVIDAAIGDATASGSSTEWAMRSFFGRINTITMTVTWFRQPCVTTVLPNSARTTAGDVSLSRFGLENQRRSFFPEDTFVDNLKFRVSWGRLGNENALGYYDFQALISTYNTYYGGYVQGSGSNPWAGA